MNGFPFTDCPSPLAAHERDEVPCGVDVDYRPLGPLRAGESPMHVPCMDRRFVLRAPVPCARPHGESIAPQTWRRRSADDTASRAATKRPFRDDHAPPPAKRHCNGAFSAIVPDVCPQVNAMTTSPADMAQLCEIVAHLATRIDDLVRVLDAHLKPRQRIT